MKNKDFSLENTFSFDLEKIDWRIAKKILGTEFFYPVNYKENTRNILESKSNFKKYTKENLNLNMFDENIDMINFIYDNFENCLIFNKNLYSTLQSLYYYSMLENKKIIIITTEETKNIYFILKKFKKEFSDKNFNRKENDKKENNDFFVQKYTFEFSNHIKFLIFKHYNNFRRNNFLIFNEAKNFDIVVFLNIFCHSKKYLERLSNLQKNKKINYFNNYYFGILKEKLFYPLCQIQKKLIFVEENYDEKYTGSYLYCLKETSPFYINIPSFFKNNVNYLNEMMKNNNFEFMGIKIF